MKSELVRHFGSVARMTLIESPMFPLMTGLGKYIALAELNKSDNVGIVGGYLAVSALYDLGESFYRTFFGGFENPHSCF